MPERAADGLLSGERINESWRSALSRVSAHGLANCRKLLQNPFKS